jgi:ribosomal protein S18 acetylase RimI-like enzyme
LSSNKNIKPLKHTDKLVAEAIYNVFQRSYQIEAALIGVSDFPPLKRTVDDICSAESQFYGLLVNDSLVGVVEVALELEQQRKAFHICSLVVDPSYFRQGIGSQLIEFLFQTYDCHDATVETAVVNLPAIELYKKYGFVEIRRWIPSHGIPKVRMRVDFKSISR